MKFTDRYGNLVNDIYVVIGTITFSSGISGKSSCLVHSFSQVQQMFRDKYGVSPPSSNGVVACYTNGDGGANPIHIEGSTYQNSNFYALFSSNNTLNSLRINFLYAYQTGD